MRPGILARMDAGDPISYEVLAAGTPVFSSDGDQIGTVTHVLAVPEEDVFDGIVIAEQLDEPGEHVHGHRFVDADQVGTIHERAVTLKLDTAACGDLPYPSENPAAIRVDYTQAPPSHLHAKLRRAWDLISGKY
jgi:hypothetical protein